MPATHVFFVSWEGGVEFRNDSLEAAEVGNREKNKNGTRVFEVVSYDPDGPSETLRKMLTGHIYIVGHGAAGYGFIADVDHPSRRDLSVNEVCDRLIASGLQPTFNGKIKCFNCHSATAQGNARPFASLFADEMRQRNYVHCQYFGYDQSVALAYVDKGFGGIHRHAMYNVGDDWLPYDRASNARHAF